MVHPGTAYPDGAERDGLRDDLEVVGQDAPVRYALKAGGKLLATSVAVSLRIESG